MKVLFLTLYDEQWASSRVKIYQHLPFFDKHGIEYRILPVITKDSVRYSKLRYLLNAGLNTLLKSLEVIFSGYKYDVIFIHNVLVPFHLEKLIKMSNKNIIYNFCDALYAVSYTDIAARDFMKILLRKFGKIWLSRMVKISNHVIVENEQNRQFASIYCQNISVITGPIDTERYSPRKNSKTGSDSIIIGWIGSPSTTKYVRLVQNALRILIRRYPYVDFELIGAGELEIDGVHLTSKKWTYESEVKELQNFDIGIMPLADNEWTRGKGGYKLLQYMACGIPCVASPVGINSTIIQDGVNGFLARNEEEWIEKISILVEDGALRREMGKMGREIAQEKYSIKANIDRFLSLFSISS